MPRVVIIKLAACYGIGIARILSAIVEQNNDENGIVFPEVVAPYDMAIIVVNSKDEEQNKVAEELYEKYKAQGLDVLLDNRDVMAGVKFKDMDLIGIPKTIIVGKNINEGKVECKIRKDGTKTEISLSDI